MQWPMYYKKPRQEQNFHLLYVSPDLSTNPDKSFDQSAQSVNSAAGQQPIKATDKNKRSVGKRQGTIKLNV